MGQLPYHLVQDFFHQQYDVCFEDFYHVKSPPTGEIIPPNRSKLTPGKGDSYRKPFIFRVPAVSLDWGWGGVSKTHPG